MHISIEKIVNSIFRSNTYLIQDESSNSVWLVDAGDVDVLINKIISIGKKIEGVLLTHAHYDHIYGLNKLFEYNNDLKVYIGAEDTSGLFSSKMNMSKYHDNGEFVYKGRNIVPIFNGDIITLFNDITVEVLAVPGHTPGCIAYKMDKYLFTGDAYIPGFKVITCFSLSNKEKADLSTKKIEELLLSSNYCVFAGHN